MEEESEELSLRRLEEAGYQQRFPGTEEEAEIVEEILADEMSQLTMVEHDLVSFDVHGISMEVEETPELIEESIREMEEELGKIKSKPSYDKALTMNPDYVTNRKFRLLFLRSEAFHAKNAANRIVHHFREKEGLFGSGDVLGRDVRMSDMSEDDLRVLRSGAHQVLDTRDMAGRAVMALFLSRWTENANVKGGVSRCLLGE